MIDGIHAAGFHSIRIPVAWSNGMSADYTINPELMNRVEEVVGYALANEMVVIINIHWDGGWISRFPSNPDESLKKYRAVWSQIAEHFKDYSNDLIFESLNEESDFESLWNKYSQSANGKDRAYGLLNSINQEFTNLIRASGGKNGQRYLLIAGYTTDIKLTVDPAFQMPSDPAARSMVSVHYYTPSTFTLLEKDASWGKAAPTWGTPAEVEAVKADMLPLKTRFLDRGIPVVLGEFGVAIDKDPASVVKYLSTVAQTAYALGVVPMLWDAGGFYNRRELRWNNAQIGESLVRVVPKAAPQK
jgi:endoglucanase